MLRIKVFQLILLFNVSLCFIASTGFTSVYYVDPTYTAGSNVGTAAAPYTYFTPALWTVINSDLATQDVTVYVSALKNDGVTQETLAGFSVKRKTSGTYRLTIDGASKYNTSAPSTVGVWTNNPTAIATAYTTKKVAKIISGDYFGWSYDIGSSSVNHGGLTYYCINSHISSASTEPGVGANWTTYWVRRGTGGSAWAMSTEYYTYTKQDYVTVRGFESTIRTKCLGDSIIFEYLYIHDNIDGALYTGYTAYTSGNPWRVSAPFKGVTFRHIKIDNTGGECIYLGAGNSDGPGFTNSIEGENLTIQDFTLSRCGALGGQGDGIDIKVGWVGILIENGTIDMSGSDPAGISQGAISVRGVGAEVTNTNYVINRVYVHHMTRGDKMAVSVSDSAYQSANQYIRGLTIKNSIFSHNTNAITGTVSSGSNVAVYNCTFDNTGAFSLTSGTGNILRNNVVIGNGRTNAAIASNNAYSGTWSGTCTNCVPGVVITPGVDFINAPVGNYMIANTSSKLYDSGYSLNGLLNDDHIGTPRPQRSAWTIGAYEYWGGAESPIVYPPNSPSNILIQ